jgi:methylenetetrahydrofolate reductase (NADPH)
MKIIKKIEKAIQQKRTFCSFEYFPPKTPQGVNNLYDRFERMALLGPEFIDVTWNAGGVTSDLTIEICSNAQTVYGLETNMHLTCTNMPVEKIDHALREAKKAGVQNIFALRGDPPRGVKDWTKCENGFAFAIDLIRYIKKGYGDFFGIGVAGYPEVHPDSPSKEADLKFLKEKVDAGADFIISQYFYDVDLFLQWVKDCRAVGINCPILPGLLPIQTYDKFINMIRMNNTSVPEYILKDLEPIKEDDQAVKEYGIKLLTEMSKKLIANGIPGIHIYTMNLERSARVILENLGLAQSQEVVKPLPWNRSLKNNRLKENVRPIFWRNRIKSYIQRTDSWDEFPNGRWGDSRSPAYGEVNLHYSSSFKYANTDCLNMWGNPEKPEDIFEVFAKYLKGEIKALPWCETALHAESSVIRERLININKKGFLSINSQPSVNGVPSTDKIHGWGPKNGFVFQKAYLELFISPEKIQKLEEAIKEDEYLSYYAINQKGDLKTNQKDDSPNAVTWGVFPGREILQPTIVEKVSFLAWKDEAFSLWNVWKDLYESNSKSFELVDKISKEYYLINIVDNNFQRVDKIYDILEKL